MLPVVGTVCTNVWYGGYQSLVRLVPMIGTIAIPFRVVSFERFVEVESVAFANAQGHVAHDSKCLCIGLKALS
ncbi:MAG: hypothetical protein SPI30_05835 [Prevotella sp.]|nr:hypothetical protein [Prevotella sp.]